MDHLQPAPEAGKNRPARRRSLFVAPVLLAVGVVLWLGPWGFTNPAPPAIRPAPWVTDTTPVRRPSLKPEIELAGYTYRCSDCHRHIVSPVETTRTLTQHRDIHLQHGINTRCFNCHHRTSRDAFADDAGGEIPYDKPQLLCAKCHGPVYRDWLNGAHGRTNGYWDTTRGEQQRRKCIECHDPHAPPFAAMHPAPGPDTLRMGDQHEMEDEHRTRNPLRVHHSPLDAAQATPTTQPAHPAGEAAP